MWCKEFKKGERVYVHSRDARNNSYEAIVMSVGGKYITCNQIYEDGTVCKYGDKFDVEFLCRVDYGPFYLYHNKEEYEDEVRRNTIAMEMKDSLSYGKYTLEELLLFKEIHETGIEKWKEEHYK
jgi:hypothetical protein